MRVIYFVLIVIASVTVPWWLAITLWAVYAFIFGAYELIVLGVLLDAYFGYVSFFNVFYLVAAVILCVGVELLRPRLAFYDASP